jgi:indolepyruvate ferredoxin oxidoreductase
LGWCFHFTNEKHIFANLGDGTYFHSGYLAIRQAIAAKLNMIQSSTTMQLQ